jgi:folate-dependent phosphoribosylglycinamide formyltransferase PurN
MLTPHHPLRVAVLCSHRAPGLLYLLNQSPDRGAAFEIVGCVTSQDTFAEEARVERRGIPIHEHPIHDFYRAHGASDCRDLALRADYDAETLRLIEPWFPDIVVLDGYLHVVTDRLLSRFHNRVVGLHYSDLTLRTEAGAPRFPGIRAVRDSLLAGCHETRATVHLVNAVIDGGPPIVRSWPFAVSPLVEALRPQAATEVINAYTLAHEQWMLRTVSGPLLSAALRLIADSAVDLEALAKADAAVVSPWLLERPGFLVAPEVAPELDVVATPAGCV